MPTSHDDVLPPIQPPFAGVIGNTWRESRPEWPQQARPPVDAPNVLLIVLDDLGFGQHPAFGGPISMPATERLAREGVRYNNFHTAALCSPTRAALLSGRNHHTVGFASIAELAAGYPSANAYLPRSAAFLPEVLRHHGYNTFCVGKWHLTPSDEVTSCGPFDRWPLGCGFQRFYGFLPGETDHWHPMLTADNHRIPVPHKDGYHLSEDLADQAISMIRSQQQVGSGKPFFMHLAFGAPHAPFHVSQKYIDRYKGRFDQGWDEIRKETFQRQKAMGVVPADAVLPPRNPGVQVWDELSVDERKLFARMMETFAGFVEHTDEQIGRVLDELDTLGIADNTLVVFMSDNGASQEGGRFGTTNTERFRNLIPMGVPEMMADFDRIGGPDSDVHYPAGWGMAGNTPFKRWKRDTHRGGNSDPLIVRWPKRITDRGAIRPQYLYVTDIYPTILDAAGITPPKVVNGAEQKPLEGFSFFATLTDDKARTGRRTQYYEMVGSRAIWSDGWTAVVWHAQGSDWDKETWELYHLETDFTQANDLAAKHPEKLKELVDLWWAEGRKYGVFPLDDRGREKARDPSRPRAMQPRPTYIYYPGTQPVPVGNIPRLIKQRHAITAHFEIPEGGAEGVLICEGGITGGWSLFVQNGHGYYVHNCLRLSHHVLKTPDPLPHGPCVLRFEFDPVPEPKDQAAKAPPSRWEMEVPIGGPVLPRGLGRLVVNGVEAVGGVEIKTAPVIYSPVVEGFQIGRSWGASPAYEHYKGSFDFTGTLRRVVVELLPGQ